MQENRIEKIGLLDGIYIYLKREKGRILGDEIKWNFTKFLINRAGTVIERYAPTTSPLLIKKDIEKVLDK